ncbi:hypothetical protein N7448_008440 [Penicillium atrosanguineum]|uniref:MOZ protein represents a chromatin-associated acetyltransferase n=1 Tax=Penicillium atrosanguineum TaxID=1132637 RepID=A0A9W9QH37_9EURO|nr:uncharacterized protein N7443_000544 [Penicillium atrosanguineum]KAJ5127661.1 hypothetical protein N7448_008440 [Penicillium atrosanguineum]KAJ5313660.1 hypothetical protein N7443_000544 [Penicillium atrosanguineum]KAJ5330832.1 hypothetical protein N7476_000615 [Penicillium atrosanguineum]
MATPRLPFLYPNWIRAVRSCQPTTYRSFRPLAPRQRFHTSCRRNQQSYHRRYGPAVEPSIPPPTRPGEAPVEQVGEDVPVIPDVTDQPEEGASASPPEQAESQAQAQEPQPQPDVQEDTVADDAAASLSEQAAAESTKTSHATLEPELPEEETDRAEASAASSMSSAKDVGEEMSQIPPYMNQSAFEEVFHMPSPSNYLAPTGPFESESKAPHLSPAPYVHHFDTYSLVLDLSKGGYTNEQSITIMKAVRTILQGNLDYAKRSLTSKSDVENESYLFQAACSELQQSLQSARNSEVQRQRASRTQLEHETDILSQRLNQELAGMKDEIKGMFNDHKMSTREQQRTIDTSVQELNYKITVSLNSDGKSEIESLRWILTRRAALTLATCALMIILFLKYSSTRKVPDPPKVETVEKPVDKQVTKETHVVHDIGSQTEISPAAHLGESLG